MFRYYKRYVSVDVEEVRGMSAEWPGAGRVFPGGLPPYAEMFTDFATLGRREASLVGGFFSETPLGGCS